ncbi:MAG: Wzz/FepE/Etk N-terminal domain-containing protein [Clostridiaceae bacterium]
MEDELRLMDVLRVFARRWKLIAVVTLVPTIVVAGVLLFAVKATYTSTAVVMVSDTKPIVTLQSTDQLADPLVYMPTASVVAYQNLAKDPALNEEVIDKVGLAGDPCNMTVRKLARAVKISSVSGSGLIQIDVTLVDSDKAALAANALADGLVARGESISRTSMPAAQQGLKESYGAAESALQAVEQQLAALYSKRDSVTELTSVRDTVLGQFNTYRAQVQTLETDIRALQLSLATKQSALTSTYQYLTTTKSITDDQTLLDVAKATSGQSVLDLARLNMTSQQINPVWQSLTSDVTDLKTDIAYKTSLKALYEKTIPELQSRVLDLNQRIDAENEAITSTRRSKDLLAAEFDVTTTNYVSSLKLEGNPLPPVRLVQSAIPADMRNAGGRAVKLAVTTLAALLLGILLAFLVDYVESARAAEAAARRSKES